MMPDLVFELVLEDDAVFSASAATAGDHTGLDYIPGAAVRGAVAAALYRRLGSAARVVFHSGAVRFHDALPIAETGETGWPVPLSFHRPKDVAKAGRIAATRNLHLVGMDGKQPEQWRGAYVTASGGVFGVDMRYVLKNSVSEATGRVEEGGLFGHHRICRGQKFALTIDIDSDVEPEIVELIDETIMSGPKLGRSRNTEFGRVRVTRRAPETRKASAPSADMRVVWLLSDTILFDGFGCSSVVPTAEGFGLAGAVFRADRSFLRVATRSFFNSALGMHEPEQTVLCRGSVLVFEGGSGGRASTPDVVGPGRDRGLGRFVVDHPLLLEGAPLTRAVEIAKMKSADDDPVDVSAEEASVLAWLSRSRSASRDPALSFAREACRDMEVWYASAGLVRGRREGIGPKPSQWNRLYVEARRARSLADFRKRLADVCTDTDAELPAWGADFFPSGGAKPLTFKDAIVAFADAAETKARDFSALLAIQYFAREAAEKARSVMAAGVAEGTHEHT